MRFILDKQIKCYKFSIFSVGRKVNFARLNKRFMSFTLKEKKSDKKS